MSLAEVEGRVPIVLVLVSLVQHAVESKADKGRGMVEERTQSVEM